MLTAQTQQVLQKLRTGVFDPADLEALERTSPHQLRADLDAEYPLRFQERRLGGKWEVGMARSLRFEITPSGSRAVAPILLMIPVYRNCIFLSGEGDRITGISVATGLRVKPTRIPTHGLALTTGRGFKLDLTPDAWNLKPLARRTVKLSDEFLQQRGWCFDSLQQFAPKS